MRKKTEDMFSEHEANMLDAHAKELKETKERYLNAFSAMGKFSESADEVYYIDRENKIQSVRLMCARLTAYGTFECIETGGDRCRRFDIRNWGETWAFSKYVIKRALSDKLNAEAEAKRKREEDAKIAKRMADSIKKQFDIDDKRLSELVPYLSKGDCHNNDNR